MKKTKALVVKETGLVERLMQGGRLTPQEEVALKTNLPAWIPEKENLGTAMTQTAQEFLVLIEDILDREYGWSQKEIINFEKKLKPVLKVLHTMEVTRDLSILTNKDMQLVGDIAEKRFDRLDRVDKALMLGTPEKKLKTLSAGKK